MSATRIKEKKAEYFAEVLRRITAEPALTLREIAEIICFEIDGKTLKEEIKKALKRKI